MRWKAFLSGVIIALLIASLSGQVVAAEEVVCAGDLYHSSVALWPPEVEVRGLIPIIGPGLVLPIRWNISGGWGVTETSIRWDTVSHANDNEYRYRAEPRYPGIGDNYVRLIVPEDADCIYLKVHAIVDGVVCWSDAERTVPSERRINMGHSGYWDDTSGVTWQPESEWVFGFMGYSGGSTIAVLDADIAATSDDGLYRRQREGLSLYSVWIGDGAYEAICRVELHFAELTATGAGQRAFSVSIEDQTVLENLDLYQEAGYRTAYVRTFDTVVRDRQLDIEFTGGAATIAGIRVIVLGGIPQFEIAAQVAASLDDTYVYADAANRHSEDFVRLGAGSYDGGLRFRPIDVPKGSVIGEARLLMRSVDAASRSVHVTVYGDAVDTAPNFIGSHPWVPFRDRTDAFVAWAMEGSWRTDTWHRSPELRDILQEIVDRPGWTLGNSVVLLLIADEGDAQYRDIHARDYDGEEPVNSARFLVRYVPPEYISTPTTTPTATPTATCTPTSTLPPTGTPTATPPPTCTPTPVTTSTQTPPAHVSVVLPLVLKKGASGSFLINGDFEEGWTGWEHGGELQQSIESAPPGWRRKAALLGDPSYDCDGGVPVGQAWMSQTFTVPGDPVTLRFQYRVFTQDLTPPGREGEFDYFSVYLGEERVLFVANQVTEETCDSPWVWDSEWQSFEYDLSAYQGQTVILWFRNWSKPDGWYNTWTYVADVRIVN